MNKNNIKFKIVVIVIGFLFCFFQCKFMIDLSYKISLAISIGLCLIIMLLIKLNIIKPRKKEEIEKEKLEKEERKRLIKEEKEKVNKLDYQELLKLKNYEDEKIEIINEKLDKLERSNIINYVWMFINCGIIIFFLSLLFFGSLDGKYLDREIYVGALDNLSNIGVDKLTSAFSLAIETFTNLIIKFYDIGKENSFIFFWTYIFMIIYWIGYLYIYKILLKGSYKTIKEVFIPMYKNIRKKIKERNNE